MSYMRVPYQRLRRITESIIAGNPGAFEEAHQYLATHCARCGASLETEEERRRVVCDGCYDLDSLSRQSSSA